MPLQGTGHAKLVGDEAPYFESLAELDEWASRPREKLMGVLEYHARPQCAESSGKLLVCHDYKGGYTESPSGLSYTFNFWNLCHTFIYFSHHRVTVPPSGWTNAAHRQGVKILGTLIFEESGSGEADCLQVIVGCPQKGAGPTLRTASMPISKHYASLLAELARQRGFDGYLLNVECPLGGGAEQARALAGWILLLRSELLTKVGPHAQAIWYDSVICNGKLRWQDRLNSLNLPFFLSSDAFFTNYTWPPSFPALTAQYFMSVDPVLINANRSALSSAKSLQNIFIGVDVWGRGSHGGGGFGSYKAITHIDPQSLGLSVALFGQAWTWESEQDNPGWNWDQWWEYERKLWIGPANPQEVVPVPDAPRRPKEPECPHDGFTPISSFFARATPPDPAHLVFCTSFSPGVGLSWFVEGIKVLQTDRGWTDVDKQSSLGDLVWPRPSVTWEGDDRAEPVPSASSALDMSDAWNGGNTLKLSVACAGSTAEDAFFRCIWLPVQSLNVTSLMSYCVHIVYKTVACEGTDLDLGLFVKPLLTDGEDLPEVEVGASTQSDLKHGWTKQVLTFSLPNHATNASVAIGLIVGFAAEDPSQSLDFSISLGQLAVYPSTATTSILKGTPGILWAKFQSTKPIIAPSIDFSGLLAWDIASSLPHLTMETIPSSEDPNPVWILDDTKERFPSFLYFNIYAVPHPHSGSVAGPEAAVFIGTTGLDGRANRFYVDSTLLPRSVMGGRGLRFYMQGVTDRGDVLPWDLCAYVDRMFELGSY